MDKPTCSTCPYWRSDREAAFVIDRRDFWMSIRGIGEKTALDLADSSVYSLDSLDRFRASHKLAEAKYRAAKEALDQRREYRGECRRVARQASHPWPVTWDDGWCGEHPDFSAWIESRKAKQ